MVAIYRLFTVFAMMSACRDLLVGNGIRAAVGIRHAAHHMETHTIYTRIIYTYKYII